jgi:hypothetical protein
MVKVDRFQTHSELYIRAWCGKHNIPLEAMDGGPFFIIPGEARASALGGDYTPVNGEWEVDLSNTACPEEITEWETEDRGDGIWLRGNAAFPKWLAPGEYTTAEEQPLDECSDSWTLTVVTEEN